MGVTKKTACKGVIYILTNPAFPEYVKIGYADDLEKRLKGLNNSSVPKHFRPYAVYGVNERLTDKKVHQLIDTLNPNLRVVDQFDGKEHKREFYIMSADDAYSIFECIAKISGTEKRLALMRPSGFEKREERDAENIKESSRRSALRFSMCGLKPGDYISFINDDSIKAEIVDDRRIRYEGEIMSCTMLAQRLLHLDRDVPIQGTKYFTYDGLTLPELRAKYEDENSDALPGDSSHQ